MQNTSRPNLPAGALGPELLGNILQQITSRLLIQMDANACRRSAENDDSPRRDLPAGRRELALCGYGPSDGRDCSK